MNKKKTQRLKDQIKVIYGMNGQGEALDWVNMYNETERKIEDKIPYEYCKACETHSPSLEHECLICGQETHGKNIGGYYAKLKAGITLYQFTWKANDTLCLVFDDKTEKEVNPNDYDIIFVGEINDL